MLIDLASLVKPLLRCLPSIGHWALATKVHADIPSESVESVDPGDAQAVCLGPFALLPECCASLHMDLVLVHGK